MTSHENSFQLSQFAILGPASLCQHYRSQRHGIRVRRTEETPGRFPISLQHGVDCIYVNGVIESHDGVMESHQQRSKTFHLLRRHQPNTSEPVLVYCHAQPQGHDSCQHEPATARPSSSATTQKVAGIRLHSICCHPKACARAEACLSTCSGCKRELCCCRCTDM